MFAALLSPQLQASHGTRSIPVRNGDTVRIMRGDHKGVEGKITRIDRARRRIYVEGLTREKVDGTAIFVPVHPSKVTITSLVLDDKWRRKILERRKQARKVMEKTEAKRVEAAKTEEKIEEEPLREKVVPVKKPRAKKPKVQKKRATEKQARQKTPKSKSKAEITEKIGAETGEEPRKAARKRGGA